MADEPIILFDGVCNLCNHVVQFALARDDKQQFRFAALQSSTGLRLLEGFGIRSRNLSSIVLIEGGSAYVKSDAVLRMTARLTGSWSVLRVFLIVPRPIRDCVYDVVAKHRYRWFGKRSTCMVPTAEQLGRFLS
jgi:predicted DCC family thiol-disulfide oxidoreductase YuxK